MKNKAFTLAELLMAVLVISIIMVALAPVITKRVQDNISTASTETHGKEYYTAPGDYEFTVPEGINVLWIKAAGGGGSGGSAVLYSYKKEESFNYNNSGKTWYYPAGVNKAEVTLIGAGGRGGNSYSKSSGQTCSGSNVVSYPRVGSNEEDVCLTNDYVNPNSVGDTSVTNCYTHYDEPDGTYARACWSYRDYTDIKCNIYAARSMCSKWGGSIMTSSLLDKLQNNISYSSIFTNIRYGGYAYEDGCVTQYDRIVNNKRRCGHNTGWLDDGANYMVRYSGNGGKITWSSIYDSGGNIDVNARQVYCYKYYTPYTNYSGAGGNASAQLTQTVYGTPTSYFRLTIAGKPGTQSASIYPQTRILYYSEDGTFSSNSSFQIANAGNGQNATSSAHGKSTSVASSLTNDCRRCNNELCTSSNLINCTIKQNQGADGSATSGGYGGATGSGYPVGVSGGYKYTDSSRSFTSRYTSAEYNAAKGTSATDNDFGWGGGGAYGPVWASSSFSGGYGAPGGIKISYTLGLPGGGGGGAAVVDGEAPNHKAYEIKYKVTPGQVISIHVGAGGTNGNDGEDTFIGYKNGARHMTLSGGKKGETISLTTAQINSFLNATPSLVSGTTNVYKFTSAPVAKGGDGGALFISSSYVKFSDNNVTASAFYGKSGHPAAQSLVMKSQKNPNQFLYKPYGLDGGMGSHCGGRLYKADKDLRACGGSFMAFDTSDSEARCYDGCSGYGKSGNDAVYSRDDDTNFNQYCRGGRGGGGAGITYDGRANTNPGSGGNGYVIIRWDKMENEF